MDHFVRKGEKNTTQSKESTEAEIPTKCKGRKYDGSYGEVQSFCSALTDAHYDKV